MSGHSGTYVVIALECGAHHVLDAEYFDALAGAMRCGSDPGACTCQFGSGVADLPTAGGGRVVFPVSHLVMVSLSTPRDRLLEDEILGYSEDLPGEEWKG